MIQRQRCPAIDEVGELNRGLESRRATKTSVHDFPQRPHIDSRCEFFDIGIDICFNEPVMYENFGCKKGDRASKGAKSCEIFDYTFRNPEIPYLDPPVRTGFFDQDVLV